MGMPSGVNCSSCCLMAASDCRTLILTLSEQERLPGKAQANVARIMTTDLATVLRLSVSGGPALRRFSMDRIILLSSSDGKRRWKKGQSSLLTQRSLAKIELYRSSSVSIGVGDGCGSVADLR